MEYLRKSALSAGLFLPLILQIFADIRKNGFPKKGLNNLLVPGYL
jgi:hypothetical protein